MLVATNANVQQQLGKTPTLSLNSSVTSPCILSSSSCAKNINSIASNNDSVSPINNLTIMSSLDVSAPTTNTTVSPTSKNSTTGSNLKCSSNNNSNQKYDAAQSYGGNVASPCNSDGNNSQNLDDSNNAHNKNKSNKNSNGLNLAAMDSTSRGERDSQSNISSNSLIRQSSASANSCSVQFTESSPNNGDSSNSSSNTSHINNDNNKSNDEEKLNKTTTKTNTIIKEEERDKSSTSSSSLSSTLVNANTNSSITNQTSISNIKAGLSTTTIVKDEKDLVKKEETSLSPPNMSPVGFGSIVGTQINECSDNSGSTTNKSNDSSASCDKRMGLAGNICNENDDSSGLIGPTSGSNLNLISNCNALNTNSNPLNSKSSLDGFCSDATTSISIGSNAPNTTCNLPLNASFIINNISSTNGPPQSGAGGSNIISGAGSGINNCMEYMQQQNHIFVFSTQLANKGADAVLVGQFPTIIAYHCTQPATKSFFEDFFLKNPMKMSKLQRQNTLNLMGGLPIGSGPGSGGQPPWLTANCNSMGKMSHKIALNKTVETITSSASNSTGSGVLNETDMMCWDQTRPVMDSPAGDSSNTNKMLENSENCGNTAKSICSGLSNDENGAIPSLQGVKVPDENLTPQQRQHREEQLAKLKKMNQFLFPENGGNDFHPQTSGNNPMMTGKMQVPQEALTSGGMSGNSVSLLNMQGSNMSNKLNAGTMRNISGNLMNHAKTGASNSQLDNMPNLGEDIIMPADMMSGSACGPNEINVIPPQALKQGCMPNINNPGGLGAGGGRGILNAGGVNLNMMNNSGPIGLSPGSLMNDANNAIMGNSPDVISPFSSNHCPPTGGQDGSSSGGMMGPHKNMNAPPSHPSDINSSVGMPQMEWSKLHHHIYEERLKNNHTNVNSMPSEIGGGPSGCQQTLTRSNSTGIGVGGMSHRTNPNNNANRGNQGPPPPYHPTQRSASVPIATQSPNPSSPNNPTSNMSLPSPRASNNMGGALSSTASPSMDMTSASSASTANSTTTTTSTSVGGVSSNNGSTNKGVFSQQGSPTPCSGAGNSNRNRTTVNNLNSNATTPLLHVSPKDIDSKNMNTTPSQDHKSARSNSQRSRSPLLNDVSNNNTMEPRFPSPGLNFTPSGTSSANTQNLSNSFKNQNSSLEQRQNLQQMPPQFCRRTDNMPLNPNSNRSNQTKMSNTFDPISSLAQMSQQLTGGGVGLSSGGVGNSPNNLSGLMGGPGGVNDININGLMGGPMMGGGAVDPSMDHCNQNPTGGGNMGMSGLTGGPGMPGPFGPGNCSMMGGNPGPICQRLLNPKICGPNMSGGFNPNQVGGIGMREAPSGFPGMMPSHRMMNHRMSSNFGNFNVSPNIQVKASTPNTIQYMPVRPQNSNNNNMRVPPSLEFLQRYANPQMMGNSGGSGGSGGPGSSPSDMPAMNGPNDLNKMPNTNNNMGVNSNAMNQMNFFGTCNQMSGIGGMSQPVGGGDQDELQGSSSMIHNHDLMNIPGPHAPMLRGMRPMRQGGLHASINMNSASRMQHPGMSNIPPNGLGNNSFSGSDNESLDCNDPANGMFNNVAAASIYQQKNNKPPPMGMSHGPPNLNPNNSNTSLSNNNILNDQNPSSNPMQNSVMMGPNSMLNSNVSNSGPGGSLPGPGNMGYKSFVGPTSNDLKYAQQYHSFQQQLYATSTRNQQPGGQQQPPNVMSPNNNPNAGFFVNK